MAYNFKQIISFSPTVQTKKNGQSPMVQSYSCKELDEQNIQGAIFYKRLIAVLLSNLAIQVNLWYKILPTVVIIYFGFWDYNNKFVQIEYIIKYWHITEG